MLRGSAGVGPPNNVSITGGTITGTNVPYVLAKSAIPIISLSSGSVAANGVISAITALPVTYPRAYCYFPANILATVKAAGFYYCTFSTTTAGIAFLDTLTTWPPTIPASPTAVSDGKGAFTGDTGEEFLPGITIPALMANSQLRLDGSVTVTNNANAKTLRLRISGQGGTALLSPTFNSSAQVGFNGLVANTGGGANNIGTFVSGTGNGAGTIGTVDLISAPTSGVLSLQKATATDNICMIAMALWLMHDGT